MGDLLLDPEIEEVSVVDAGANRKKRFPIVKAKAKTKMKDIRKAVEAALDTPSELELQYQDLSDANRAALRVLEALRGDLPEGLLAAGQADTADLEAERAKVVELQAQVADMQSRLDAVPAADDGAVAAVEKALDAERGERAKLEKALGDMRHKMRVTEWTAVCKSELTHDSQPAEQRAEALVALEDAAGAEIAKSHFEALAAASTARKESAALQTMGSRGEAVGDAMSQIQKAKSEGRTLEQILAADPTLYERALRGE